MKWTGCNVRRCCPCEISIFTASDTIDVQPILWIWFYIIHYMDWVLRTLIYTNQTIMYTNTESSVYVCKVQELQSTFCGCLFRVARFTLSVYRLTTNIPERLTSYHNSLRAETYEFHVKNLMSQYIFVANLCTDKVNYTHTPIHHSTCDAFDSINSNQNRWFNLFLSKVNSFEFTFFFFSIKKQGKISIEINILFSQISK